MLKTLALSFAASAVALAQTPVADTVLRSSTRLVVLDVTVNNDKGPVRGLTKEDFVLEDKGKKQAITLFDVTEPGKPVAPPTPLPGGVASNRLNSKGEQTGTATVILWDRINSPSASDQAFVRNQVLRLLAGLKETDRVGLYALGFTLQMVRDYDEDAAPLARVAKALLNSGTVPNTFSVEDKALFKALSDVLSPMQQPSNQARVNITYPAFRSIGRHLGGIPGRKNLIWIAAVFPLTFANSQERRKNDQEEVDAFRNSLTEANITLYTVDPGGTGASFNTSDGAPAVNEGGLMPGRATSGVNTNTTNSMTGNQAMQFFADATGGKSYRNANDIEPALREVIAMSSYTYTLGFYPDEKTLDNRSHDLKVSLVKKPATDKAKATHRKQYFAWGPKSPRETQLKPTMAEIMEDSLLANSIGLMAVTNPDPAKPGTQVIDLRINTADLRFDPKGDQFASAFDIAIAVEGEKGQKLVSMKTFAPSLSADVMKQVMTNGLDTRESIDTGGAAGVFRIAILEKSSGATGSIRLPFGK